ANVVAPYDRDDRGLRRFRLPDRDVGRVPGRHVPERPVAIHQRCRGRLLDDRGTRGRVQVPVLDRVDVGRDADHAVGVVAGQVRADQRLAHLAGDVVRGTGTLEDALGDFA